MRAMTVKARLTAITFLVLTIFLMMTPVRAENQVTIHFFYDEACTHCLEASVYLDQVVIDYPGVTVERYDVDGSENEKHLFQEVKAVFHKQMALTPFIVIGGVGLVGFSAQIEADLEELIIRYLEEDHVDIVQN